jgi:murein DD-endopeptidase MepM/ murein hydrolase activator NlpD
VGGVRWSWVPCSQQMGGVGDVTRREQPVADDKKNVPEWIQKQRTLRRDVVDWPLHEFRVLPMGAHGAVRKSAADGWCPYKSGRKKDPDPAVEAKLREADYPCTHYGADLSAPKGTRVYAPHDGWILYAGVATRAPFVGYDPGVILIAHHDVQDSVWERGWKWATGRLIDIFSFPEGQVATRYSLLGHVVPLRMPPGEIDPAEVSPVPLEMDLTAEEQTPIPLPLDIDDTKRSGGKPDTDHWKTLADGTIVMMTSADAVKQNDKKQIKRWVNAGDHIGYVSATNHVHWELRTSPLAGIEGRVDPIGVWQAAYGAALPPGTDVSAPDVEGAPVAPDDRSSSGGGGMGALLLFAAIALGGSGKKRGGARRRR